MTSYELIKHAIRESKEKEFTNGMATEKTIVETRYGVIEVIRKTQKFLFILKPNKEFGHIKPNIKGIKSDIELICKINNSDVNIVPKKRYNHENQYTIVVPKHLF